MIIDENDLDWKPDLTHPLVMSTLRFVILCAPSGSGKSTYAAKLQSSLGNAKIVCPDVIRAELCNGDESDQSKNALIFNTFVPIRINGVQSQNMHCIFDAVSTTRKARKNLIWHAKGLGYSVEAHVFRVPIEECKRRNQMRQRQVPEFVIDRQFTQWQEPSLTEGFDKIVEIPYP